MRWFKHDSDAHMDAKMRRLIHKWGFEGYGLYWYCLELIAKDVTAKNLTFELEHDAEILAHDLRMSREKVEDMMRHMVELGLFEASHGRITCLKLFHRIDLSQGGSKAFRDAITNKRNVVLLGQSHDTVMTESCIDIDIDIDIDLEDRDIGKKPRKRGPPKDFIVDQSMKDWAAANLPHLDYQKATDQWLDYCLANGRKFTDWRRAWMNGMRKADEWRREKGGDNQEALRAAIADL